MMKINKDLKEYIENEIFKEYLKNDKGHDIEHIKYVINRSFKFAKDIKDINLNMVYVIAAFHDIGHHIDKDRHEIISGDIFFKNEEMKKFFNYDERVIIKEAIYDHRASLEYEPRTIYGKIVSSADRNTSVESIIKRTHLYTEKHFKNLTMEEILERAYNHIKEKYSKNGYAKMYFKDIDYEIFLNDIEVLISDKDKFNKKYIEINRISI